MKFVQTAIAKIARFIVGYGSPLVFGALLWTAFQGWGGSVFGQFQTGMSVNPGWFTTGDATTDLLLVVGVSIAYLWMQGIAAAWGDVGGDSGPMIDMAFSLVPAGVLLWHVADTGTARWEHLVVVGSIVAYDLIVNTKILFKVARLTSELASAKGGCFIEHPLRLG